MEKIFVRLSIVTLFAIIGSTPIAFGDVFIQNDQRYVGDDGSLHIVGEIKNNLNAPLNQVSIKATLYDENNSIIGTKETSSLVNTIMPSMKGPFDFVLTDSESKKTQTYSLDINYKVSTPKSQEIDITSSKLSRDKLNNLMITGTVANNGDITANTIAIIATLYDKAGNVAAVSRVHPEPDYLRTEEQAFFLLTVPDKTQTIEIQDYSLIAESEEYATVPEFPFSAMVLLCGTLSAYIGITKFSKGVIANLIAASNPK